VSDIVDIAARLGARLRRSGLERVGPCPVCGGTDRFAVNPKKEIWNCRGCAVGGDAIALVRHVLGCSFDDALAFIGEESRSRKISVDAVIRDAFRRPIEGLGPAFDLGRQNDTAADERMAAAVALWASATDPRKTPVETYLASRALDLGDDIANEVLRWHSGAGCMVALFRDILTDEPRAVSRTFLTADGRKLVRKFLGPVGGCAIKLDSDDMVLEGLHLAEGVETALSARQLGLKPTWALGSCGAVASFPVLPGVECLTLLQEHDEASAKAVETCARRWFDAGREVVINEPIGGKDLNDAIQGKARA
jgi:hypothetical protein